tara:strand:- start:602 stop:862 length:261 start_codon:yes stop_codon:yes gene_type:complete
VLFGLDEDAVDALIKFELLVKVRRYIARTLKVNLNVVALSVAAICSTSEVEHTKVLAIGWLASNGLQYFVKVSHNFSGIVFGFAEV